MMKKLSLLVITLVLSVFLTGCGTKTLTCTNTQEQSGVKMDQEVVLKFVNNKVDYIKMTVDSKAQTDLLKNNWSIFVSTLDKQFPSEDADGIKVETKDDEKNHSYKISIEADFKKASDDNLKKYKLNGIADKTSNIDAVKKSAEKSGFTCK